MGDSKKSFIKTGQILGPYRIIRRIGRGGMGEVFEAHEEALDRTVAIKVLNPSMAADEDFVTRFRREAKAAAALEHPNIVPVYSVGEHGPVHFIAMQFVHGATLSKILLSRGTFPAREALSMTATVADALDHAHSQKMIHRDIKPDNVMIDAGGRVWVMDFGLARPMGIGKTRLTRDGIYLGTPEYSSPEQCEGGELGPESDLYSLGVVLYEMLGGRVPYSAKTPLALFNKITTETPKPIRELNPGVSPRTAEIVEKLLAKKKEDRFRSAAELSEAVRLAIAEDGELTGALTAVIPPESLRTHVTKILDQEALDRKESTKIATAPTLRKTVGRRPVVFGAVTTLLLAALIITSYIIRPELSSLGAGGKTRTAVATGSIAPVLPKKSTLLDVWKKGRRFKVVVLDFKNITDTPELEWMTSGVADMLLTDLSQCSYLSVVSREQLRRVIAQKGISVKGRTNEVLDALGADLALCGDICKVGGQVRLDARVTDHRSGANLFAHKVQGGAETILEMLDRLSLIIRTALDGKVSAFSGKEKLVVFAEKHRPLTSQIFVMQGKNAEELKRALETGIKDKGGTVGGIERERRRLAEKGFDKKAHASGAAVDKKEAGGKADKAQESDSTVVKELVDEESESVPGAPAPEKAEKANRATSRHRAEKAEGSAPAADKPGSARAKKPSKRVLKKKRRGDSMSRPEGKSRPKRDGAPGGAFYAGRKAQPFEDAQGREAVERLTKAGRKYMAVRYYYSAHQVFERKKRTTRNLRAAKKMLETALQLTPEFSNARALLKKVEQELEKLKK